MNHDAEKTSAALAKHLNHIFAKPLYFDSLKETDFEGFDGMPVAAVQINGLVVLYPHEVKVAFIHGTVSATRWALDILVAASDTSVGIYGCEPQNIAEGLDFQDAIIRVGSLLMENALFGSFQDAV